MPRYQRSSARKTRRWRRELRSPHHCASFHLLQVRRMKIINLGQFFEKKGSTSVLSLTDISYKLMGKVPFDFNQ
jgi:hypothetical protein